jgi:arylsulfatase A-like enzyme
MITRMDRDVGRLLDLLKQKGVDNDTLILFSSDNGPHREGGHSPSYFESQGGLRGIKRDFYEGGIRVPTLARWPGKIEAGRVSDHPWAFWDFMPTACEIAGAKTPKTDGISILPELLGREQPKHEYLYWEMTISSRAMQAARVGNWKGVRLDLDDPIEIYDLASDLSERKNVAAAHPEIVRRIEQVFRDAHVDSEHFPLRSGL